ncbi:MAG: hypothetical protein WC718_01345 [Phycisphaerales bacterium]|jgi:hypothetical protein
MFPIPRLYLAGASIAALLAAYHFTPIIGPHARLVRAEASRAEWQRASEAWQKTAGGWKLSFDKSEGLRATETGNARKAVADMQDQCAARVKAARTSAKLIKEITHAPVKTDASGCPMRAIVGADRLRDALQPRPGR